MTAVKTRKKLIEVALPLEAINIASSNEKTIRQGHPSSLHLYWARRPLATARAVIFAQMVDDPSANPDLFPTEQKQNKERQRLFRIIENLVKWENTTNEEVLQSAREEIWQSWRRACADNADHPQAKELFNRQVLPAFHDPFAGGGALPLEAQRLGLVSYATDLNPVAILINKAMIEIPPRFAGLSPVNPDWQSKSVDERALMPWQGAQGLADDVRFYGEWVRDEAAKRIGNLYPPVEITETMAKDRSDLKPFVGEKLPVISWIWARTVKSPNPAFANVDVPLASSFMVSTKEGKEAYVDPVVENGGYTFRVKVGKPEDLERIKKGTKISKGAFECLMSGAPFKYEYVDAEANAGRMSERLMAIVVEGKKGRIYLSPTPEQEAVARSAQPEWKSDAPCRGTWASNAQGRTYGFKSFGDYFTPRQSVALNTLSDMIVMVREKISRDAVKAGFADDSKPLRQGGVGSLAYAEAVSVYLTFALSKQADLGNSLCRWEPVAQCPRQLFGRQGVAMIWDYAEGNPLGDSSGAWAVIVDGLVKAFAKSFQYVPTTARGYVSQADAHTQLISSGKVVSTDPPYYDNIGYADLSDFFYVWSRRSLGGVFPELFTTLAVPKAEELVATSYRHGGKEKAEEFFLHGMTQAMSRLAERAHSAFPVTIYYAFKQSESESMEGTASTGWETFLDAVIRAGFSISGTWPMRTENGSRMIGQGANALASSIVLVCRKLEATARNATRQEFIALLKSELPLSLRKMQEGNIAPVDLAQSAIGPGIAAFTSYSKVIGADGNPVTVREALALINQVLDEQLAEQEGDWDADTRWSVSWFDEFGFNTGAFGRADDLARAKNTSVQGVVEAGVAVSTSGKVRILKPEELPVDWAPETDKRLTVWEMLHHLIRLQKQGEAPAAAMLARLGDKADPAKELAYRLYGICEKKKRSTEGQLYNDLIVVWPDLVARSKEAPAPTARPGELNLDN